jgi:hypothetical protein
LAVVVLVRHLVQTQAELVVLIHPSQLLHRQAAAVVKVLVPL